ncbi:glycosyltransferase [Dactylosporangium roseum]|uniref:Glycosyltransferase n=1 Tax=Dactylosporangium roseum TaxID=47989 RepID=A0ABY5Z7U9_9ACTN|nr:glycosyltransferase [Dactylosporangium roseum]UWZ37080.1 glycosyltransferase [Dactylosporangium roseum]
MRVATMVRGWIATPAPPDVVYAPMAIASAVAGGLTARGHSVDFYAPHGSRVPGVALYDGGLDPVVTDRASFDGVIDRATCGDYADLAAADRHLARLMARGAAVGRYDVLLFHHLEVAAAIAGDVPRTPVVSVLWDPPGPELTAYTAEHPNLFVIAVSDQQRRDAGALPVIDTVYPGIDCPADLTPTTRGDGGARLVYLGRLIPEKGPDIAVQVATRTGAQLDLLGPVRTEDQRFFDEKIRPYLGARIRYRGHVPNDRLADHLAGASALLMPIRWQEPFGLVMIEAMAHGVPVIGFGRGAVPEIVAQGVSGYVVESTDEMCRAVRALDQLTAEGCRRYVRQHFSVREMVDGYQAALSRAVALASSRSWPGDRVRVRLDAATREPRS